MGRRATFRDSTMLWFCYRMGRKALAKRERVQRPIRFPGPMYVAVKELAERNHRSANAEVLAAVEAHLARENGK